MASFPEVEVERLHPKSASTSWQTDGHIAANDNQSRTPKDSSSSKDRESNNDVQRECKSYEDSDEKIATTEHRERKRKKETQPDESEVVPTSGKKSKPEYDMRHSSKTDYVEKNTSRSPSKKRSRKSSSSSPTRQKKHKHKKRRDRSRSRERRDRDHSSRKESHSKSDRKDSTGNSFREQSASPRKLKRERTSPSVEKEARRSPDRSPKRKRKYSEDDYKAHRESEARKSPDRRGDSHIARNSPSVEKESRRSSDRSPKRKRKYSEEDYRAARKSPDRTYSGGDSHTANSSSSRFKIPKKKRSPEEDRKQSSQDREPATNILKVSPNLLREIESLLRTEHHHIIRKEDKNDSLIPHVKWCYYYLDPKLPGHITGGRAHLHHFCRVCKRTCLHLLGKYGTGQRKCLVCAADEMGWDEDEVPSWYFHDTCEHCENDTRRRSGGGGGYGRGGGYRGGHGGGWQRRSWRSSNY